MPLATSFGASESERTPQYDLIPRDAIVDLIVNFPVENAHGASAGRYQRLV